MLILGLLFIGLFSVAVDQANAQPLDSEAWARTMVVEVSSAEGVCAGCPIKTEPHDGSVTGRPAVALAAPGGEIDGVALWDARAGELVVIAYGDGLAVAKVTTIHGETDCPPGRWLRSESEGFGCLEGTDLGGHGVAKVYDTLLGQRVDTYPRWVRVILRPSGPFSQQGPG